MDDDKRTMYDLVKNAMDVQDASNLSGCIHSFSRDISRLRVLLNEEMGKDFSTDALNRHPICILWASKIASLTRCELGLEFSKAYDWCCKVMREHK